MTVGTPRSLNHRLARSGAVEASLIGTVGAGAVLASIAAAPEWSGAAGAVLAGLMLAIAVIDHRRMIIPDELNALAFIAGLIAAGARQRLVVQRLPWLSSPLVTPCHCDSCRLVGHGENARRSGRPPQGGGGVAVAGPA